MGKLIVLLASLFALPAVAEGISQYQKDAIREHYEKLILGRGQDLTVLQQDVVLYRRLFSKPNTVDTRELPQPEEIPWPQIFKGQDLTIGEILRIASAASGYDAEFDPQVDQSEIIKINSHANSLRDIAEYLTRVSGAQVSVYPEARSIIATKKASTNG